MVAFILPFKPKTEAKVISPITEFEKELIDGLKSGNRQSVDQLYRMYSAALYGIICRIVKFDEIAEDVLQDTFVKIWKNIGQYDPSKGRIFTWMVNLAKNAAIDQVRSKNYVIATKTEDLQDVSTTILERKNHISFNPDHIGVKQLTGKLKPDHKQIVDLFYFDGLTHVEVSEKLNIPLGTVKTKLRQSILQLRQYFNEMNSQLNSTA